MRTILTLLAMVIMASAAGAAQPPGGSADSAPGKTGLGAAPDSGGKAEASLPWKKYFPLGQSIVPVGGLKGGDKAYEVRDSSQSLLGWVFRTDQVAPFVKGYITQVGMLVAVSTDEKIIGVQVVDHRETPKYMALLTGMYYRQFNGHAVAKPATDIDAVTSATITCVAITKDIFLGARTVLKAAKPANEQPKQTAAGVSPAAGSSPKS